MKKKYVHVFITFENWTEQMVDILTLSSVKTVQQPLEILTDNDLAILQSCSNLTDD